MSPFLPRIGPMTRILHILDHSLPMHSGYTFRTRAILRAQRPWGGGARNYRAAAHRSWPGHRGRGWADFPPHTGKGQRPVRHKGMARGAGTDRCHHRAGRRLAARYPARPLACTGWLGCDPRGQAAWHSGRLRDPRFLGRCRRRQSVEPRRIASKYRLTRQLENHRCARGRCGDDDLRRV